MARNVDPIKVHLVTLAIWGFLIACVLFVWLFPKVLLFLGLTILAAWVYAKLYGVVEKRLEEFEPIFDDEADEPTPLPKKRKRAVAAELDVPAQPIGTPAPDLESDEV